MITITVRKDNHETKAQAAEMQRRINTPGPIMKSCGEYMLRSTEDNFRAEGRPVRWPPSRRAEEGLGKTLTLSARLRRSITYAVSGWKLIVGTNVKYAKIHQLGGVIKPKLKKVLRFKIADGWRSAKQVRIPARPFLVVQKQDEHVIADMVGKYIAGGKG